MDNLVTNEAGGGRGNPIPALPHIYSIAGLPMSEHRCRIKSAKESTVKIYLGWVWLNPKNGSYTDQGPTPSQGWTERHLVPFRDDCWGWGWVPCPPWED